MQPRRLPGWCANRVSYWERAKYTESLRWLTTAWYVSHRRVRPLSAPIPYLRFNGAYNIPEAKY